MPTAYVKQIAEKHGLSVHRAEQLWEKAKSVAKNAGKTDNMAYVTGIFKRMVGETSTVLESVTARLEQAATNDANDVTRKIREIALGKPVSGRPSCWSSIGLYLNKFPNTIGTVCLWSGDDLDYVTHASLLDSHGHNLVDTYGGRRTPDNRFYYVHGQDDPLILRRSLSVQQLLS